MKKLKVMMYCSFNNNIENIFDIAILAYTGCILTTAAPAAYNVAANIDNLCYFVIDIRYL